MKLFGAVMLFFALCFLDAQPGVLALPNNDESDTYRQRMRGAPLRYMGRPYVWGATGLKSFDCSGLIWRAMHDNGVLIKRTTVRKYYLVLPRPSKEEQWNFGNIVFFNDLRHAGIVDNQQWFFHAGISTGTARSSIPIGAAASSASARCFWRKELDHR